MIMLLITDAGSGPSHLPQEAWADGMHITLVQPMGVRGFDCPRDQGSWDGAE